MKKEHIKWANFCCFITFLFTKLAQTDKPSPAAWARLVPISDMEVRGSGLHETAKVNNILYFYSPLMLGKNVNI